MLNYWESTHWCLFLTSLLSLPTIACLRFKRSLFSVILTSLRTKSCFSVSTHLSLPSWFLIVSKSWILKRDDVASKSNRLDREFYSSMLLTKVRSYWSYCIIPSASPLPTIHPPNSTPYPTCSPLSSLPHSELNDRDVYHWNEDKASSARNFKRNCIL